uniref:GOSR2 n=1 Tax=Schistocephalus solidus TaxID=70667 RepID=A0A183TSX9_SCHSO
LNVLSNNEAPRRRSQVQVAIDQIQSECKFLRSNLQNIQRKRASKEQELLHRASLFAMPSTAANGMSGAAVVRLDTEVDEFSRLNTVGRRLDEMLISGSESLSALKEQRNTLKGTQRRVLDLMNTLGLSNAVMRLIQRRSHQDKVLFYVLCAATLILMWGLWRFIRG